MKYAQLLIFHAFWLVFCKLMRIRFRIKLITLMRIQILFDADADPVVDPGYHNAADPDADSDPQHWPLASPSAC